MNPSRRSARTPQGFERGRLRQREGYRREAGRL